MAGIKSHHNELPWLLLLWKTVCFWKREDMLFAFQKGFAGTLYEQENILDEYYA
jgi:hypothetical protein